MRNHVHDSSTTIPLSTLITITIIYLVSRCPWLFITPDFKMTPKSSITPLFDSKDVAYTPKVVNWAFQMYKYSASQKNGEACFIFCRCEQKALILMGSRDCCSQMSVVSSRLHCFRNHRELLLFSYFRSKMTAFRESCGWNRTVGTNSDINLSKTLGWENISRDRNDFQLQWWTIRNCIMFQYKQQ